jgi:6-pyruvoyltetrahydropterin/6-carboxytetrahydropterin synthase
MPPLCADRRAAAPYRRAGGSAGIYDLGYLRSRLKTLSDALDHRFLDEIPGLGKPTLENLCLFIAESLADLQPAPSRIRVWRDSIGDGCVLDLG